MLLCCPIHAGALLQFGYMVDAVVEALLFLTDFNGNFLVFFVESCLSPNFTMLDYTYVRCCVFNFMNLSAVKGLKMAPEQIPKNGSFET